MDPVWLDILLDGYRHRQCVVAVVRFGVSHNFTGPRVPNIESTRNHASAREFDRALVRSIADGQAQGAYLVLDIPDSSINDRSTQSELPDLDYDSVRRIARQIEALAERHPTLKVKLLKEDVKSALRLIAVAAGLAAHFSGSTRDLAVIDLALPFGWTGSPPFYRAFGEGISFLVARESPNSLDPSDSDKEPFFSFVWVDDHILLEVDKRNRLVLAESALRLSMLAVLGQTS
ncbi:hypothetical protein ON010_g11992 [Phytophthora cinnamomi]|nr:hypothetical protein ON010_g11992 [Phytophthora cinnamomi]